MTTAKLEQTQFQPITRLAFVSDPAGPEKISIVRALPTAQEVSSIETASGQEESKVIEH